MRSRGCAICLISPSAVRAQDLSVRRSILRSLAAGRSVPASVRRRGTGGPRHALDFLRASPATETALNRPARDEPVPAPARHEPRGLVPLGRGGARTRPHAGQADPAVDRVRGLPLVPRDGARVVRGPGDRGPDERALRLDQGRPRGAPRPGRDLHGRRPGDDRQRRLADDRVPDDRRPALLRRHVLPGRGPPRPAVVPQGAGGDRGRLGATAATRPRPRARR